jgi:hypothetical protein
MAPLSPIARRPYNYSSPQAVARSVKKIALKLLAIPELEFSVGVWRHDLSLLDWRLCNGATDRAGGNRCNPARNRRSDDQLPDAASYAPPPAGHSDGKRWAGDVISTTKRAIPQGGQVSDGERGPRPLAVPCAFLFSEPGILERDADAGLGGEFQRRSGVFRPMNELVDRSAG